VVCKFTQTTLPFSSHAVSPVPHTIVVVVVVVVGVLVVVVGHGIELHAPLQQNCWVVPQAIAHAPQCS